MGQSLAVPPTAFARSASDKQDASQANRSGSLAVAASGVTDPRTDLRRQRARISDQAETSQAKLPVLGLPLLGSH